MKIKTKIILFSILLVGLLFRYYNLNWDQGFHLHPDERAIVMFTLPLEFPKSLQAFLLPQSTWNPHFFAYGNFPLYLLKISSNIAGNFYPEFTSYGAINILGRLISVFADLGTIFLIFLIGKLLINKKMGLLSSFFYSISVLPIQASHFYAVDIFLTFFILLTLYRLLIFYQKPNKLNALFVGIAFGFSLSTKISSTALISAILPTLLIDFFLIFIKKPHKINLWLPHFPIVLKKIFVDGFLIFIFTFFTFIILQPYAIIDFPQFIKQNLLQSQMTHNAYIFPYTLQYVGKIPYIYELKNVFLWGQGPILASLSFLGTLYFTLRLFLRKKEKKHEQKIILAVFFWVYFLVVGNFSIGFMRYMLPLYPFFSIFAAVLILQVVYPSIKKLKPSLFFIFSFSFLVFILIWPLSFMNIYQKQHTRVSASHWINKNIPAGSTITVEHWDDSLPLFGQSNYNVLTLSLYDPDSPQKWEIINNQLLKTDYIIIASNRLYVPLQKLTDCQNLPPGKCYPLTANYYKKLFNGSSGFKKVAEFSVYPGLEIGNWKFEIDDSSADESFTVYDHPKVMIFENKR
ncbi:MAG: glycosyltransferase family 39 protein [Candidatus Levybacteria bacterium]|nr:glycosyltransferase family 39 protein [Candidatus Levybacteria bacterium]